MILDNPSASPGSAASPAASSWRATLIGWVERLERRHHVDRGGGHRVVLSGAGTAVVGRERDDPRRGGARVEEEPEHEAVRAGLGRRERDRATVAAEQDGASEARVN